MTYNVSSGTLNSAMPNFTIPLLSTMNSSPDFKLPKLDFDILIYCTAGHTLFYECAKQLIVLASHHVTTQSWLRLIVLRLDVLPALRRWRWQVQMQIRWQLWRVRRYSHPLQVLSIWKMSSCRHATSRYVVQSCSFLPLNCKVATFTPASTAQSAIGNEQSKAGGQSSRLRGHTNAVHVQSELITQE